MVEINKQSPVTLKITGTFLSGGYQNCKLFAQKLRRRYGQYFRDPAIRGLLEVDWVDYLSKVQKTVGGQSWAIRKGVVVYINDFYIGGEEELFAYYKLTYEYEKPTEDTVKSAAKAEYLAYLNSKNLLYTYMEFSQEEEFIGSLLFELQVDLMPKTCSRFAFLCDAEGQNKISYKGSSVLRICKGGWFQAGRFISHTHSTLENESFCYSHDRRGIISFTNQEHECTNEFFVTFTPSRWMDRRYVAFGRVVEGWNLLKRMENTSCSYESPTKQITISNCGLASVGFGRKMLTNLRVKGITIGDPHIDLDTFVDLVLDSFAAALFNRLDQEIRTQLNSEWMAAMVWETVEPLLKTRQPIEDFPDVHDISSNEYLYDRFLAGRDVLDHYIRTLLDNILNEALVRHQVTAIAKNIVSSILISLDYKPSSELAAQHFMKKLISNVNLIIYGREEEYSVEQSVLNTLSKTVTDSLSKSMISKENLSGIVREIANAMSQQSVADLESKSGLSAQKSLASYIWGMLLNEIESDK